MFSLVCVCMSMGGIHVTIPYDALDRTVPVPSKHWNCLYRDLPPSTLQAPAKPPLPDIGLHNTKTPWLPLDIGPHFTGTPPAQTPGLDPTIQWLPASDIWWPSLETCSNLFTWWSFPPSTYIWWLLKHVQLASGWYASYWNAFLFSIKHGTRILSVSFLLGTQYCSVTCLIVTLR